MSFEDHRLVLRQRDQLNSLDKITEEAVKHLDEWKLLDRVDLQLENGDFWRLTFEQFSDADALLSWFYCQGESKRRVDRERVLRLERCL